MTESELYSGRWNANNLISAIYRVVLLREPEPGALEAWRPRLESEGVESVLKAFVHSPEFKSIIDQFVDLFPFDQAPRQSIETEISPQAMSRLWDRVSSVWTKLGRENPYYSVLTDPQWQGVSEQERLDRFYATGAGDLARLKAWLSRNALSIDPDKVSVEYGCGVGRFTEWLATACRRIVAIDVSESHLALAKQRGERKNIASQVEYFRVASPADLSRLHGVDLFYSVIVLQHNPPPIIALILDRAFAGLNRGGVAYFQVPTRRPDGYSFSVEDYLRHDGDGQMEMHAVDQNTVFKLAHRYGVRPIEVAPDYCADRVGISTTFLMRKE